MSEGPRTRGRPPGFTLERTFHNESVPHRIGADAAKKPLESRAR